MRIVVRSVNGVSILDITGGILIGDGDDELREAVRKLVDTDQMKVLLNFAEVPYVDGAGLGEIVRSYSTIVRRGGKLKLLRPTKNIDNLLSVTKLRNVFEIFEDEAMAVASFAA